MPLLWLALAFITGTALSGSFVLPLLAWSIPGCLGIILLPFHKRLRQLPLLQSLFDPQKADPIRTLPFWLIWIVLFSAGAVRCHLARPQIEPGFLPWYANLETRTTVEGLVVEPSDVVESYTNLTVEVDRLRTAETTQYLEVHGKLLAQVPPGGEWRYGDRVRVKGVLETPPEGEDFSYREYLARKGIYAMMSRAEAVVLGRGQGNPILGVLFSLKERALKTVYQIYPDPEASLLAGILLGVERGISRPLQDAFKETGTSHIIAISGFNMSIIAGLFAALFSRWLGRWKGAIAAAFALGAYTVLVGANAAVVRAALMSGVSILAGQVGRRQQGLNSLGFVAGLMVLHNPWALWDIGFQLSFTATLGLILYAQPLSEAFIRFIGRYFPAAAVQSVARLVAEYFLFTLAAQLMTLPVMAYHFQRISLISLVVNPFILPAQPAVMILGGLAVLVAMVVFPLGQVAAYFALPFVVYTIRVVELFVGVPGGEVVLGKVSLPVVAGFYALLFLISWKPSQFDGILSRLRSKAASALKPTLKPSVGILGIALLAFLTWRAVFSAPDGRLHVTLLDVGSGDAILIQTPTGRYMLVDGGPSANLLAEGLGRRLPLGMRQLDTLFVAGSREEQVAALPAVVERFPPQSVVWAGATHGTRPARELQRWLVEAKVPLTRAETGQWLDLGQGAKLRVLAVSGGGAVLLVEWEGFSMLLPLGPSFEALEALQEDPLLGPVTVMMLSDSGYAPLNPPEWIEKMNPQLVVLSVAADDREGRPSPETLDAVFGYELLRTDRHGWVEITTDGKQMWVEKEHK